MGLQGYYLLPHPPIVLPAVGKGEENKIKNTMNSLDQVAEEISQISPKTIIVITPHGTMFQDAISLSYEDRIKGDFKNFGVDSISMDFPINKLLTSKIYQLANDENIPVVMTTNSFLNEYNTSLVLDHGVMVPCYFINKYYEGYQLVHITYGPLRDLDLYKFGLIISEAVNELNEDAIIIASGDLSHKLKNEGPYEFNPMGARFDRDFLKYLEQGDVVGVFNMDKKMISEAGECGRRSVLILLGALDGKRFSGNCLSYEGTFGVGYGIMKFNILSSSKSMIEELESTQKDFHKKKYDQKDPYVRLARDSLTEYVKKGEIISILPKYITDEMIKQKRGVFVSLKKHGELRGCIGTIRPVTENIAREIIRNAIEAGMYDPRFYEVEEDELLDIDFSVDVLTKPEPASMADLNVKTYGVIVKSKGKTGLLLPDLEGISTVEEQLSIALKKAGIEKNEDYSIERFKVIRHQEE